MERLTRAGLAMLVLILGATARAHPTDGWRITEAADDTTAAAPAVDPAPAIPVPDPALAGGPSREVEVPAPTAAPASLGWGVVGVMRIDGEGRGVAAGLGLTLARDRLEGELMVLRSGSTGGYLGARYRLRTGRLRPYGAVGVPAFVYDQREMGSWSTKLGLGLRVAAGLEVAIHRRLSLQADLGYEHFFVDARETRIDADVWVPTVGVLGRL